MGVERLDADTQNIPHRQPALIAELRRRLDKWSLHVPNVAGGVWRLHVTIDELGHTDFQCAGPDIVVRDQSIAGREDEGPLGGAKEGGYVMLGRAVAPRASLP